MKKEYQINIGLSNKNGIINTCTQNKKTASDKIAKLDETRETLENTIKQSQNLLPAAEATSQELANRIQTTPSTLNQKTLEQKKVSKEYSDMLNALS